MKKITYIILISIFALYSTHAQKTKIETADKAYNSLGYINANKIYRSLAESGYGSAKIYERIGNSDFFNANYEQASYWYKKLIQVNNNPKPNIALRYAQSLRVIGNDKEAQKWYDYFKTSTSFFDKTEILPVEMPDKWFKISNLTVNTEEIEFAPYIAQGKLYFSSSRITSKYRYNPVDPWTGLGYLNIFEQEINEGKLVKKARKIAGDVNSNYHESSICISKDGKTLYFTKNAPKKAEGGTHIKHLKIYRATLKKGEWVNIEELSINGEEFSTAHPALNFTEDKLYFSSDRPGSFGQTDIYVASIEADGSFTNIKNLGSKINTPGRESFPFVSKQNELYFSSDGYMGYGGYDVFYVKIKDSGTYSRLVHLGSPLNSKWDDFSLFSESTTTGLFSSNRPQGKGRDDVYNFTSNTEIYEFLKSKVVGKVFDEETLNPLSNAKIEVFKDDQNVATFFTDDSGQYEFDTELDEHYMVKVEKSGYNTEDNHVVCKKDINQLDFALAQNIFEIRDGIDLAKILHIQNIHFDYAKSEILVGAEVELQKAVSTLKLHPELRLEVKSYTDSRGSKEFNLKLSNARAKATVNYIVDHGISASRVKGKGFGESNLLNDCGDGKKCSEQEHQKNRRSEFLLFELKK